MLFHVIPCVALLYITSWSSYLWLFNEVYFFIYEIVQGRLMISQLLGVMVRRVMDPLWRILIYRSSSCLFIHEMAVFTEVIEKTLHNAIFITQRTWICLIFFEQEIGNTSGCILLIEKSLGLSIFEQNWISYKWEKGFRNFDFPLITSAAHMRAIFCSDIFHGICLFPH